MREHDPDGTRRCGVGAENHVFVEHHDGTVMGYIHLTTDGALVAVGESVARGQPLGLSGDSGCGSGPHLHVALQRDRTDFGRKTTLPVNFRNAVGPLTDNRALVQGESYTAAPGG